MQNFNYSSASSRANCAASAPPRPISRHSGQSDSSRNSRMAPSASGSSGERYPRQSPLPSAPETPVWMPRPRMPPADMQVVLDLARLSEPCPMEPQFVLQPTSRIYAPQTLSFDNMPRRIIVVADGLPPVDYVPLPQQCSVCPRTLIIGHHRMEHSQWRGPDGRGFMCEYCGCDRRVHDCRYRCQCCKMLFPVAWVSNACEDQSTANATNLYRRCARCHGIYLSEEDRNTKPDGAMYPNRAA